MLPLLSRGFNRHIVWLGALLFFLPKINLLSFSGETAGIRVDDLILGWITFLIFLGSIIAYAWVDRVSNIEKTAFIFIGVMLASNVVNIVLYHQSSVLYSLRLVEYFVFFYIGIYFAQHRNIKNLILAILIANGIVIVLQSAGVLGGFTSEGYRSHLERAIGLTGGPWEVGAVINICFAILVFNYRRTTGAVLWIFLLTTALLLLTAARMPTVANVALLIYFFYLRSPSKGMMIIKIAALAIPVAFALILIPNPVAERSANIVNIANNFDVFVDALDQFNPKPTDTIDQPETEMVEDSDASWVMRAAKWATAVKLFINTPTAWVIGTGPGHLGTSVDGGWIRLWSEVGPIGFLLFVSLFKKIARINLSMKAVIIGTSISMVMIDIYMAYKVMTLLFFIAGYMLYRQRNGAASQDEDHVPATAQPGLRADMVRR